jgi:hypothetical protein
MIMKKYFLYALLVLISSQGVMAQNTKYKYFRPSILQTYTPFSDPIIQEDLQNIVKTPIADKIDLITATNHSYIFSSIPEPPKKRILNSKKAIYEKSQYELGVLTSTQENVYDMARQLVGVWYDRNREGYMSGNYLLKMGVYSAVQQDINLDQNSQNTRLFAIGEDLISKSYIVLYRVKSMVSYKEIYDKEDEQFLKIAQKKGTTFKPVLRTRVGYFLNYDVFVYKLDWNDATVDDFWKNYYVDTEMKQDLTKKEKDSILIDKRKKISNYNNFKPGIKLVATLNLNSESANDIYLDYYLSQLSYVSKATTPPKSTQKTTTPPVIDYEKKGDEAMQSKNYGAAMDLYTSAFKANLKNTGLKSKITQADIAMRGTLKEIEAQKYGDNNLVVTLKRAFVELVQDNTFARMSAHEKIKEDFKVITSISGKTLTKLKVPIGTKEDLQVSQRYVAYELLEKNGSLEKNYIGYCRATKNMAQNKGKISGTILPSKLGDRFEPYNTSNSLFVQQAGKKLNPGVLLEFDPDKGQRYTFDFSLASFASSSSDNMGNEIIIKNPYQIITVGYGFDARKVWELFGGSKRMGPQNLFFTLQAHYFMIDSTSNYPFEEATRLGAGLLIEREIYTGISGFHLIPSLYGGYPLFVKPGLGIGYNINRNLTIAVNKQFIYPSLSFNFKFRF